MFVVIVIVIVILIVIDLLRLWSQVAPKTTSVGAQPPARIGDPLIPPVLPSGLSARVDPTEPEGRTRPRIPTPEEPCSTASPSFS